MHRSKNKFKGNNLEWYYTTRRASKRKKVKRLRNKEVRRELKEEIEKEVIENGI
ncbi:hypothetical protein [Mesotoga prima]|uniref:hypothetical protein n=1 Tax=Mesotoga prima TaxID=1184387 RepID=UPI002FD991C5